MHQISAQLQMQSTQVADLIFAHTQRLQADFVLIEQQCFQTRRQPDACSDLLQFVVGQIHIVQMLSRFVVACIIFVHTMAQQKIVDLHRLRILPRQLSDCLPYRASVCHIAYRHPKYGQRFQLLECDQIGFEIAWCNVTGAN